MVQSQQQEIVIGVNLQKKGWLAIVPRIDSHNSRMGGGTWYFTIDYAAGFKAFLPDVFTDGLDEEENGCLTIRYGGRKYLVIVRSRKFEVGWSKFVKRAKLASCTTFLVAHGGGRILSVLDFKGGIGGRSVWDLNADVFDVASQLMEEDDIPEGAITETCRTTYSPPYISLFFAGHRGVCLFQQTSYLTMEVPGNLAQHLRVKKKISVNIRRRDRVFQNVNVGLGHFRGACWSDLVEVCDFVVGFKIYLFINPVEDFEMIVIGYRNLEVIYEWTRTYYMLF